MKKAISLCLIISMLTISLCGCSVYVHDPVPPEYEAKYIIGHTYEEITDRYGQPDIINTPDYTGGTDNLHCIYYMTSPPQRTIIFGFFEYSEFLYIGFDKDTGLANVFFHPEHYPEY